MNRTMSRTMSQPRRLPNEVTQPSPTSRARMVISAAQRLFDEREVIALVVLFLLGAIL